MRNPFAWLVRRSRGELAQSAGTDRKLAGLSDTGVRLSEAAGLSEAAALDGESVRRLESSLAGLRTLLGGLGDRLERHDEKLALGFDKLEQRTSRSAQCLERQVDEVGMELVRFHDDLDERLKDLETQNCVLERKSDELIGRTELLHGDSRRISDAYDHQLRNAEKSIETLRLSSEQGLERVRESHRDHVQSLVESRRDIIEFAARSRELLGRRILDVAESLERAARPPAAARSGMPTPAKSAARRRLSRVLGWFRRRRAAGDTPSNVERRLVALERSLEEQAKENLQRSRLLRQAWTQERELFPEPRQIGMQPDVAAGNGDGGHHGELPEDGGRLARRLASAAPRLSSEREGIDEETETLALSLKSRRSGKTSSRALP